MNDNKYKIALLSAFIGTPGKSELKITPECQQELKDFGVDIYLFNNTNKSMLEQYYTPSIENPNPSKSYFETMLDNVRFKQSIFPSEEANYSRLLAKLPKMQFYKFIPNDYDYYIWCDSKFTLCRRWLDYVLFLIERYKEYDFLVSEHSERSSIKEELDYMIYYMKKHNSENLCSKYNMAEMHYQVRTYLKDKKFKDNKLFELGFLIFSKNILKQKEFLDDWYGHNYFFTIQDQLSLPYLCFKHKIKVCSIKQRIYDMPFTMYNYLG